MKKPYFKEHPSGLSKEFNPLLLSHLMGGATVVIAFV